MNTTVTFWKPELFISALPTGLTVALKPLPSTLVKPPATIVSRERRAA